MLANRIIWYLINADWSNSVTFPFRFFHSQVLFQLAVFHHFLFAFIKNNAKSTERVLEESKISRRKMHSKSINQYIYPALPKPQGTCSRAMVYQRHMVYWHRDTWRLSHYTKQDRNIEQPVSVAHWVVQSIVCLYRRRNNGKHPV